MRHTHLAMLVVGSLGVSVTQATSLSAQDTPMMHQARDFDASRAILSDAPMFDPFHVTATQRLSDALRDRVVEGETPLLVVERGGRTLGVLTMQMAYHHVAQGTLAGEPWMVAF